MAEVSSAALVPRVRHANKQDAVDRVALQWIARFRFVTAELLGLYLGVTRQNAQARARRLETAGLLSRQAGRPGESITLAATARGMRAIGLPPRRAPRTDVQREHELALVWLVLQLEARVAGVVFTERECRRVEREARADRMSADVVEPGGHVARRWPDLVHRRVSGDLVVLELERTLKNPTRLVRIIEGYGAASWFAEVRLLCADPAVARGVALAVKRADLPSWRPGPRVVVAPWPGLVPVTKLAVREAINAV